MTRGGAMVFRCLSLVLGLLCAIALGEIGLRVFGYEAGWQRLGSVFDPAFGVVKKDSWVVGFAIDPARQKRVDIRGQVIPLPKPPGETRILFIGDSATEGVGVQLAQTFPLRFQGLLSRRHPGRRVRAVNAGAWGMTSIDEYYLLKLALLPLQPDAVVLGLFLANDINFNLGHGERRLRSRPPYRTLARLRDVSALVDFLYLEALVLNERYKFFRASRLEETELVPVDLGLIDSYGIHMLNYPAGEVATYLRKSSRLVDHAFEVLEEVFRHFLALGRENGFSFRVLLIPSPSAVEDRLVMFHHPDILGDLAEQGIEIRESELDFRKPARRVLAICRRLEIECVDPTADLGRVGLGAFLPGDEHLSRLGHEIVARKLAGDE
jgi:lysophospholipase L1-like esterase